MAPKVGYLLPTRESVMQGRPAAGPLLKLAEQAEELGYDSIWIGDSLLDRPRHEPLVMLAGVAARTKRVLLGTGVLLPALRNPVQLAHQVATLDQISEGRIILGIGISPDHPGARPNSPQSVCLSKSGSGGCSNPCGYAVRSGPESRSRGTGAGGLRTRRSARSRTAKAAHQSGWAAIRRARCSVPHVISTAGSRYRRRLNSSVGSGGRFSR